MTKALKILAFVLIMLAMASPAHSKDYKEFEADGDSISVGIGTSNPPATSYPAQANIRGFGIGSSCVVPTNCDPARQVLSWWPARMDSMVNPPSTVVFMIGTNDYPTSSADQIIANMRRLQNMGQEREIRVVFGTITPAPADSFWNIGHSGHAKETRLAVNTYLRNHPRMMGPEYARALQCGAQDLCPQFIGPMNDVHVNDAGAKAMGVILRNWVKANR